MTGLILLVVLCLVTDWTIRLIVLNAKLSGRNSYIEVMGFCFGERGRAGVSFFQFAFAFGGMCAFGVIIGQSDTFSPHLSRNVKLTLRPPSSVLQATQSRTSSLSCFPSCTRSRYCRCWSTGSLSSSSPP